LPTKAATEAPWKGARTNQITEDSWSQVSFQVTQTEVGN